MSKVKIVYSLSEKGRKASLLAGGDGKRVQTIEAPATKELLELADVGDSGEATWRLEGYWVYPEPKITGEYDFSKYSNNMSEDGYECRKPEIVMRKETKRCPEFDEPQTADSLLKFHRAKMAEIEAHNAEMEAKAKELEKLLPEKIERWERAVQEKKEQIKRFRAEAEERKAKEAESKAAYENDRREWILAHGSQYLKDCLELGIKANLEYVVERAAMEFPGYTVDYADSASWGEKVSPSEEAIAELKALRAKGCQAEIVWLENPAEVRTGDYEFIDDDDYDGYGNFEFTPREAVVIWGYLGSYDLVKEF
jgi:hypothetical protein